MNLFMYMYMFLVKKCASFVLSSEISSENLCCNNLLLEIFLEKKSSMVFCSHRFSLKWHYAPLMINSMCKVEVSIYIVTNVYCLNKGVA